MYEELTPSQIGWYAANMIDDLPKEQKDKAIKALSEATQKAPMPWHMFLEDDDD